MFKKTLPLILIFLSFTGCVAASTGITMPGTLTVNKSDFDSSTEVSVEPVSTWGDDSNGQYNKGFKIGLYKSSRMDKNDVVFIARYMGIENIEKKDSLSFNIDGEIISLDAIDIATDLELDDTSSAGLPYDMTSSSRKFQGNISLVNKIINSKRTVVKLNLLNGKYAEGVFISDEYENYKAPLGLDFKVKKPKQAFSDFVIKLKELKLL